MIRVLHTEPLLFHPGDTLSRDEFLKRWEQMPFLKFAELIDGMVFMPSPLSASHGSKDNHMQMLLAIYAARVGFCQVLTNATWLMLESAPQPDAGLRVFPEFGGRTNISGDDLVSGSPELVVEICVSSRSYDLGPKRALYQRAQVMEYVAVLVEEQRVEWRVFESGSYRLLEPDENGILRSPAFPGLWLDSAGVWEQTGKRLLSTLQAGLDLEEAAAHARWPRKS